MSFQIPQSKPPACVPSGLFCSSEWPISASTKQTARGRKQDRARVAGGQDYEVSYESRKTGRSAASVKKAVTKVRTSRKRVERRLGSAMKKSLGTAPSKRC
jgi:hypothetical protein